MPDPHSCGPFTIDAAHHAAQVTGTPVRLSRTEYALLTSLVQRAPRNNQQPQRKDQNAILSDRSCIFSVCGVVYRLRWTASILSFTQTSVGTAKSARFLRVF